MGLRPTNRDENPTEVLYYYIFVSSRAATNF
jgi:hypothetical protein